MFVGSCNQPTPYFATANGDGVSVFTFDPDTGTAVLQTQYPGIDNPTFLSVTPDGRRIYVNSEKFGHAQGLVTALSFDPDSQKVAHLDMVPSRGSITSHNSFSSDGRFLLVTNYANGFDGPDQSVAAFPIHGVASIAPACSSVAHKGHGQNTDRQERSHAHCVHQLPNGLVAVADLGLDQVIFYTLSDQGTLTHHSEVTLPPETGPRHLTWSSDGTRVFVVGELNSTLTSIDMTSHPWPQITDVVSTRPAKSGINHCSDVQISTDCRFAYVANRGDDTIATIAIGPQGRLNLSNVIHCGGTTPRALGLTPCGARLLSANQDANCISMFAVNKISGELTALPTEITIGTPMCIKFAEVGCRSKD